MGEQTDNRRHIFDENKDGRLNSSELLKFLSAEDKKGGVKPLHGIIELSEVDTMVTIWNRVSALVASGQLPCANLGEYMTNTAKRIGERLEQQVGNFNRNPDLLKSEEARVAVSALSPEAKAATVEQLRNFAAFAARYKTEFPDPQGIDIAPQDVVPLLRHFGDINIPTCGLGSQERQQRRPEGHSL